MCHGHDIKASFMPLLHATPTHVYEKCNKFTTSYSRCVEMWIYKSVNVICIVRSYNGIHSTYIYILRGGVYMLHIFELFCDYKYYKFAVILHIVQYTVYNVHCTI